MKHSQDLWRWFFLLAALEAGVAIVVLITIPREGTGYSITRGAALAFLAAWFFVGAICALRPPSLVTKPVSAKGILGCALLGLVVAATLFVLRYLSPETLLPYYKRLSVLLWFLLAVCVQGLGVLLIGRYGLHSDAVAAPRILLRPAGIAFAALLATFALVAVTRLGLTPDSAYWGEPGVPVLGWQLAVALLAGLGVLLLSVRFGPSARLDTVLAAALWLLAVVIWLGVPLQALQNSFYAPIRPPSSQAFPNSDAGYYDSMAQSLLIGYPYQGEIPTRPLYIVMLTILHLVVGERYDLIIAGQTLVLALIPVLLFRLGCALHSRAAGTIAALAAIGREGTTLLVSSETRVSNTKMLLVDLPTLLVFLACCFFTVRWLERKDVRSGVIAGGVFGLLLLLRTQVAAILPAILLLGLFAMGARRRFGYLQMAAFVAALILALLPWLIHNYLLTGQFSIDAPFQYRIIASQYQYTGNLDIANMELEGKGLLGILATFAFRDPQFVLGFIANHAFATQIGALLALPLIHTYNGLLADISLHWVGWDGTLGWQNTLLAVAYLGIIGIGLGSAWNRMRWAGVVPLAFSLGYSLANGIARFSGWRYDLPADWIAYFYFALGVAEVLVFLAALFGAGRDCLLSPREGAVEDGKGRSQLVPVLAVFFVIGLLPWLAEYIASPRYGNEPSRGLAARLATAPAVQALGISAAEIGAASAAPGTVLEIGRALYPRFFSRGNGLASAHPWPAYAPRDFPRLGFLLLNQSRHDVILATRQIPWDFTHAADVIVLGCRTEDYVDARLVLFLDSGITYQGTPISEPCP
ncbi:MAG: glycosyltransferase family 39 protein [Chloroflexota bacterium]